MSGSARVKAPQVWIALARCYRALSILAERSIEDSGLGLSDFMVLEALLHKGPLSISEIQQKVLLASGSMTAAVDRVEQRGWAVRRTTAEDRRARLLELTPEGRRTVQEAFQTHAGDLEEAMSVLDDAEKRQFFAHLRKLGKFAATKLDTQDKETKK